MLDKLKVAGQPWRSTRAFASHRGVRRRHDQPPMAGQAVLSTNHDFK